MQGYHFASSRAAVEPMERQHRPAAASTPGSFARIGRRLPLTQPADHIFLDDPVGFSRDTTGIRSRADLYNYGAGDGEGIWWRGIWEQMIVGSLLAGLILNACSASYSHAFMLLGSLLSLVVFRLMVTGKRSKART